MAGIRKKSWKTKTGEIKTCWEINYYINGKQVRKSGFKTRLAAQNALPTITNSYSTNITIKELANAYLSEHCVLRCKESTINLYKGYIKNNFQSIINARARSITKRSLDLLIIDWKKQGLQNKTINDLINFTRSIYCYGIKNKWISENPAKEVETLPKEAKDIKFLTEEEMREFMEVIKDFPIVKYTALITDLYTGLRISELLALEWGDIDFKNLTISVNKQYYKGKLTPPKTYKSTRKVSIPPFLAEKLLTLKKEQKVLSKIIFCSKDGGYISQDKFVATYFKRAMRLMGKGEYNFHCLRHTYATFLLSNGIPLKYVQEQLGHSTPQTTLNTYNHVMPNVNKDAIKLFKAIECEHFVSMEEPEPPKPAHINP